VRTVGLAALIGLFLMATIANAATQCLTAEEYNQILTVVDGNTAKADALTAVICSLHWKDQNDIADVNADLQQKYNELYARDEGVLTSAQQYADQAELNAKQYADEKYNYLLTKYNELYARDEGIVQTFEQNLSDLNSWLQSWASEKDENVLAEAKLYTDQTASSLKYDINNALLEMKNLVKEDKNYMITLIKTTLEGYASKAYVDDRLSNFAEKIKPLEEFRAQAVQKLLKVDEVSNMVLSLQEQIDDLEKEVIKIDQRTQRNPLAYWAILIGIAGIIAAAYLYNRAQKGGSFKRLPLSGIAAALTTGGGEDEKADREDTGKARRKA